VQLCWRNGELTFASVDGLLAALTAPPPGPGLVRGNDATDLQTLAALAREPEIRHLAQGRSRVRLLWEACQIPDYRKLADDSHVRLCGRLFAHIVRDGGIPTDWIAAQIATLSRADGDIDTLMQRLAGVRVWSYVAARTDWVRDAAHWQGRAREVEDMLSDALHERLTTRFVDRRAALLLRRLDSRETEELLSAVTRRGEVVVEGHPVGHMEGFRFVPDPSSAGDDRKLVVRAARRALREEMPRRIARVEEAADHAFALTPTQRITWEGASIARLRPGVSMARPQVEMLDAEYLYGPQRERVRQRLQRFLDAHVQETLAPLFAAAAASERDPALRGSLHRLVEGLGVVPGATESDIAPELRGRLKRLGVRAGRYALFLPALLKPRPSALRAALWALRHRVGVPALPPPGAVSLATPAEWPDGFAAALGWVDAGPVLLRLDVAERAAAELAWATRGRPCPVPPDLGSRLGVRAELLPAVLRCLGMRLLPAPTLGESEFGPPAPAMMMTGQRRRRVEAEGRTQPARPAARRDGPFASLATLLTPPSTRIA
jgi:ATP-dependent RNA helicase SUPV3L1/SUV3